jgi:molecular chaperone DnaJ
MVEDRSVTVEIPAGIESGSRMRVTGRGAAGDAGGRPGDLYVEVAVAPDPRFDRHGADLVHRLAVGFAEATLGTMVTVPTVDGDDLELDIPAATQPGTVFKLARLGMPRLRREVQVEVPRHLTADQESALREYADRMGEHPAEARRRRRRHS